MHNSDQFTKLIESSRLFEVLHANFLENNVIQRSLLNELIEYFVSYVDYHALSIEQVVEIHTQFLNEYTLHLKEFAKSKKYPYQNKIHITKSRLDYDIPLLCSTFLTYHRFCIMETLSAKIKIEPEQSVLIVGVGPGIELSLLYRKSDNISVYDTMISNFIRESFPKVHFYEQYFKYEPHQRFDHIILIEILEHVEKPDALLIDAMKSLNDKGRIHFTTAINIPQFDHLYNFQLDDKNVEDWISKNHFEIEYKADIPHHYLYKIDAFNSYYILKKSSHNLESDGSPLRGVINLA